MVPTLPFFDIGFSLTKLPLSLLSSISVSKVSLLVPMLLMVLARALKALALSPALPSPPPSCLLLKYPHPKKTNTFIRFITINNTPIISMSSALATSTSSPSFSALSSSSFMRFITNAVRNTQKTCAFERMLKALSLVDR